MEQDNNASLVVGEPPVSSTTAVSNSANYYETDTLLAQYLEFHFGKPYLQTENYPAAIVNHAIKALGSEHGRQRALDLGSAVGRASFELARHFQEVIGVDYSVKFIDSATSLQQNRSIRWKVMDEGELSSSNEVNLQELGLTQELVERVKFVQGDACSLKDDLTNFDVVIAANLIDRLYEPLKFLNSIQDRISTGGILAISSPYTWLEEHTKKENWLGGFKDENGRDVTTLQRLEQALSPRFRLVCDPIDVPFVIRETKRKFQHTFAQLSLWRKLE